MGGIDAAVSKILELFINLFGGMIDFKSIKN
jgi:hypothetical protein